MMKTREYVNYVREEKIVAKIKIDLSISFFVFVLITSL